ncbi:MAG: PfkB family carbohydrate kinase [Paludibacteraceae bacterium]|nr:PfkB family carbohydrate kinase [Paludibacteraceae bacterium]
MRRIIGIGETVLDVVFHNDQPQAAVPGGSTFNALVSLGRTVGVQYPQVPITMITQVGDDHIGDMVMHFMQQNHIDTTHVVRHKDTQTHVSMAFLDKNNDAQYEFYKDHAHAHLEQETLDSFAFRQDDIVVFGSFFAVNPVIHAVVSSLLRRAHEAGAILYYDINFRPSHIQDLPEVMDSILENCRMSDIVRGSAEDFLYLFGTTDALTVYEQHIRPLCPNFIFTNGAEAIETFSPGIHCLFRPLRCKTVSTIGAGDNFNAGIVYSLVRDGVHKNGTTKPVTIGADKWTRFVRIARRFSAAVCRSIYNYVDEDFISTIANVKQQ